MTSLRCVLSDYTVVFALRKAQTCKSVCCCMVCTCAESVRLLRKLVDGVPEGVWGLGSRFPRWMLRYCDELALSLGVLRGPNRGRLAALPPSDTKEMYGTQRTPDISMPPLLF